MKRRPPPVLERRHTDEFLPPPPGEAERRALSELEHADRNTRARGRVETAAGLLALNRAAGATYYDVPDEAARDPEAAAEAFAGTETVLDVQTHFVADRSGCQPWYERLRDMYRGVAPDWWTGLDDLTAYDIAAYLRCVFVESETAVAVLTSAPGLGPDRMLWNREMAGVRELFDRLGGEGRLLHHCVVHPDDPADLDAMAEARERFRPVGWKVYTLGGLGRTREGWWLDDERTGVPFLERARALEVPLVCAHKGISNLVPTGSPRDVGPAASRFSDLAFVIYHAGYEMPSGEAAEEGPYHEGPDPQGVDRLIRSLRDAGLGPGSNVYAELGSTWFCLIRRPEEAAHVLGKLLRELGEDNVIWGTDSIWYGPSQPAIDAFRRFQIPEALQERHGYPALTPERKAKILGGNAARVYGIDLDAARERARHDGLAWVRDAEREARESGLLEREGEG